MKPLQGKVALVAGASRGAGRGIALALGDAGCTVYATGRTARDAAGIRKETVDDTADLVVARGGKAVALRCDHASEAEVKALAARVGPLDICVCNAWGGYESHEAFTEPLWEQPFELRWRGMFENGVRAHLLTAHSFAPLLRPGGLLVFTVAWMEGAPLGNTFYDVAKSALVRAAHVLARELRPRQVTTLAVAPGFMRTERVVDTLGADSPELATSESPEYVGRALAALAADPGRMELSGQVLSSGALAARYDVTDVDGRRVPPFRFRWIPCPSCGGKGCERCRGIGEVAEVLSSS